MIGGFVKTQEWFRLCFFIIFFTAAGFVLNYFYNLAGLLFEPNTRVAHAIILGILFMVLVNFLRKKVRAPSNKKLAVALFISFVVSHYLRWTMHLAWLRSFDWTEDGLHPLRNFYFYMDYFWHLVNEGAFPGFYFLRDMLRFNRSGWLFTFYDFELHLHGLLLLGVWLLEVLVISGLGFLGILLNRKIFLSPHCSWAKFQLLPYPFARFTDEDIKRIEAEDIEVILTKTFAEGEAFSQIALCFAGKTKTDYIAVVNATMGKRGKARYKKPRTVYFIGDENVEKMENLLKETHGQFLEKDKKNKNPGIELVKEITKKENKRR